MPDVPHIAWPLRIRADATGLAEVEQDTIDDVRQCVHVLLATAPGVRPLAPDVGIDDPTFTDVDPDLLAATIEAQEDRAAITVTVAPIDETGERELQVQVALTEDDDPSQEEQPE